MDDRERTGHGPHRRPRRVDTDEVIRRLAVSTAGNRGERVDAGSVERVMGELAVEWDRAHPQPSL